MRQTPLAAAAVLTLLHAPAASALQITPEHVEVGSEAFDWWGGGKYARPASIPAVGTVTATGGETPQSTETSATTDYSLRHESFRFSFEHSVSTHDNAVADTQVSLFFSLDTDVRYALDGFYTAVDPEGRNTLLEMYIHDRTLDERILQSYQQSRFTADESFVLGGSAGDDGGFLAGSLQGELLADHDYQIYLIAWILNDAEAGTAATASGAVNLVFLPEPGAGLLALAGVLGASGWRRRRRRGTAPPSQ